MTNTATAPAWQPDRCRACGEPAGAEPLTDGRCEDCALACGCCEQYRAECPCDVVAECWPNGPDIETGYFVPGSYCRTHRRGWED